MIVIADECIIQHMKELRYEKRDFRHSHSLWRMLSVFCSIYPNVMQYLSSDCAASLGHMDLSRSHMS